VRTDEGRLFQTVGAQHENRRAAMFVDEDCVDSRSDIDDLRTRDCLYDESRPVRYSKPSVCRRTVMHLSVCLSQCLVWRWVDDAVRVTSVPMSTPAVPLPVSVNVSVAFTTSQASAVRRHAVFLLSTYRSVNRSIDRSNDRSVIRSIIAFV